MDTPLDLLGNLDCLCLPQTLVESFWHADWKSAYERDGILGLCIEAIRTLFGLNSHQFYVPLNGGWSGHNIHQLLAKHGIAMWGWSFANGEMFFLVKKKQAAWAQYVMLRAGVPLQGPLLAQAPDTSTATDAAAKRPPQRSTTSPHDLAYDFEQQFDGLIQKVSSFLDL